MDLPKLHEEIYQFLTQKADDAESTQPLRFTLRNSNAYQMLEKGYWFFGTHHRITISFWNGIDWVERVPNIFVEFDVEAGTMALKFVARSYGDAEIKKKEFLGALANNGVVYDLHEERSGVWRKTYGDGYNTIEAIKDGLDMFLAADGDKQRINSALREGESVYNYNGLWYGRNGVSFLSRTTFERMCETIEHYRAKCDTLNTPAEIPSNGTESEVLDSPWLSEVTVKNFRGIKELTWKVCNESGNPYKWIFLTGENGFGKTSLLQAAALGISNFKNDKLGTIADLKLDSDAARKLNTAEIVATPTSKNVVGYGAKRLDINGGSTSTFSSLFDSSWSLLSIEGKLKEWNNETEGSDKDARNFDRLQSFMNLLSTLLPQAASAEGEVARIVPYYEPSEGIMKYREQLDNDEEQGAYEVRSFNELASGFRSIIAMVGDMLLKLEPFQQEQIKGDFSQYEGVVIIDEIDLYLHPKWQRELVKRLDEAFPNLQFIVSTHSPIPLLGAPENTGIYTVSRTTEAGIQVESLNHLKWQNFTTQVLLTSPIFDMDFIIPESHDADARIRTEETYEDVRINDDVKERLKQVAERLQQQRHEENR